MKLFASIANVYFLILQRERQLDINKPCNINTDAISMHASVKAFNYFKKTLTYNNCYRLNGFSRNSKFTKSKKNDFKSIVKNATTIFTHSIFHEQYQHLLQVLGNNINSFVPSSQVNSSIIDGSMNAKGNTFSFKHFASNVYNFSSFLQQFSWTINSGATDHMLSNKSLFSLLSKFQQLRFIGSC